MTLFHDHSTLLETLLPWFQPRLRQIFRNNRREAAVVEDNVLAILTNHGMDEELLLHLLEPSLQNRMPTFMQQLIHVAVRQCIREACHLMALEAAHAAGGEQTSTTGTSGPMASQAGSPGQSARALWQPCKVQCG